MSLGNASEFKHHVVFNAKRRNRVPIQRICYERYGDTMQRREQIDCFGYGGKERAAYRNLKILRTAYLQL